jgi:hypothetical protein
VRGNLFDFWSFVGIEGDHSGEKVFEFGREEVHWSSSGVSLPESVVFLVFDQLVVGIISSCLFEWWVSGIHDEQNDSCSENVALGSLIVLGWNLGGHVAFSSQLGV